MSTQNTKNTASLYWFGPLKSKTLRPVVGVNCLRIAYEYKGCLTCLILASGRGQFPDSWSVTTRRPKSMLHILPYPVDLFWPKSTEVMSCTPCLEVVLISVVWGIFWKVFRRSCGPATRSVGHTDRSVGLLAGWTYLSGTVVSLVGGDPEVPMCNRCSTHPEPYKYLSAKT
jgi:hypothetical protein